MSDLPARRDEVPGERFEGTRRLCCELVGSTGIDGAGVALFASELTRDLIFVTDSVAEELDEIQFTVGEGPCMDAFRFHRPELHDDIVAGDVLVRWPIFSTQAAALGVASVYAYPLVSEGTPFGVLELFGRAPVALAPREDVTVRLYAESIGRAVVSELDPVYALLPGSDDGVFRRGNVNVVVGIVAVQLGVPVEEALVRLRARAFSRQRRITVIARDIVHGALFDAEIE
ncbi:GAF domain-containing protein [Rhodococcus sp. 1.20]